MHPDHTCSWDYQPYPPQREVKAEYLETLARLMREEGAEVLSEAELRAIAAIMRGGKSLSEALKLVDEIAIAVQLRIPNRA